MAKRSFKINIPGRVKKVNTTNFVSALFEAISNSIHAIDVAAKTSGIIDVEIIRAPRQGDFTRAATDELPITAFVVTDNGIGFNNDNMNSFCEADTTFTANLGGKGVGRFTWLKFFDRATIESVYQDGEKRFRRTFSFSGTGVDDDKRVEVTSEVQTTVRLDPLAVIHESRTRRSLDEICTDLVEHFIAYFVTTSMPRLKIRDGAAIKELRAFYLESIGKNEQAHTFTINSNVFNATSIKFFLGNAKNCGLLCGDKRVADKISLDKRDPFLSKRFADEDLRTYALQIFVQSPYLDRIVNDDREGFRFPEPGTIDTARLEAVTKEEIAIEVLSIAHKVLGAEIDKLKVSNVETVSSFVSSEAPQYRPLLNKHRSEIEAIHGTSRSQIDLALRRLQFEDEEKTRCDIGALMKKAEELVTKK